MPAEPSPVSLTCYSMEGAFGEYHGYLETESDPANLRQTTQHAIPWPSKHGTSGIKDCRSDTAGAVRDEDRIQREGKIPGIKRIT
jgi:hypothetical protein